jgi:hypothetical protein
MKTEMSVRPFRAIGQSRQRAKKTLRVGAALIAMSASMQVLAADPFAPQPPYCNTTYHHEVCSGSGLSHGCAVYQGTLVEQRRFTCSYSGTVGQRSSVTGTTTNIVAWSGTVRR